MLVKTNGAYGAKVGHRQVFTKEGAIEIYKMFLSVCYNDVTMESAKVLSEVEHDLNKIGFTWDEIEKIEIDFLESGRCEA